MKQNLKDISGLFITIGCIVIIPSCEENFSTQNGLNINAAESISTSPNAVIKIISNCDHPLWTTQNQAGAFGTIDFVTQPLQLILGNGSLRFDCPDSKFLRYVTSQFSNQEIKYISQMSYSTYVDQRSWDSDNIYLVIQVDLKGDGVLVPLVFNPEYQTAPWVNPGHDQGPIVNSTWQTWDLFKGVWWMGPTINPENGGKLLTLEQWYELYPEAKLGLIRFQAGAVAGAFGPNFIGYLDNFLITIKKKSTLFDFEYCQQ